MLFTLALLLRINGLSGRSLWTDEFFTFFQSTGHGEAQKQMNLLSEITPPKYFNAGFYKQMLHNDPSKTISDVTLSLIREDTHPPFYFWTIYFWIRLFGDSIFAVRFFSVLMGLFSVLMAYKVTKLLFGDAAAVFSALFMSVCPFAVIYSREARHYSLIALLALVSWFFLLRFERKKRNADLVCAALFNSIALLTHYFYFFIILGQLAYFMLIYRKDKYLLDKFLLSFFCSFLLLAPWFNLVASHGYNFYLASWPFGYFGFFDKIYYFLIAVSRYIFIFEPRGMVMRGLLLAGIFALACRGRPVFKEAVSRYRRETLFCCILFLVPISAMFIIDIVQHGVLLQQERFLVFPFIGLIPLSGYFLRYLFRRSKIIFLLFFMFLAVYSFIISIDPQFGPAPKRVAEWINSSSQGCRAAVIMGNIRSVVLAQAYYMDEDILIMPVADTDQLVEGVKVLSHSVDKIFIVRHFNRTDPKFVDPDFIKTEDINSGFKLTRSMQSSYVKGLEFTR
jgi:uncharacterized membrane protein